MNGLMAAGYFDALAGNDRLKADLSARIESGTLAHAYIIEGGEGSGRHTLVTAAAAEMAGDEFADRILRGGCPDIETVGLEDKKKTIGVDTVRLIKEKASLTTTELDFRFLIIEHSELMTVQAQNALLKLLEEPPAGNYLFLLTDSSARLLPTVRSRAVLLRMERFSEAELTKLLLEKNKNAKKIYADSPDSFSAAVKGADGCYGKAAELLGTRKNAKSGAAVKLSDELVGALAAGASRESEIALAELLSSRMPSDREELSGVISVALNALRDMLAVKAYERAALSPLSEGKEPPLSYYTDAGKAAQRLGSFSTERLLFCCEVFSEILDELKQNVNVSTARVVMLMRLISR